MLDKRLSMVAAAVRPGSRLADIGTDHALLPVELVKTGICPSAIATDIAPGPLSAARRAVQEAGLEDRIALRLGDGLGPILPDEVDDIVIAGMGGENMAAILSGAPWLRHPRYQLILQPMSRPEKLREYLYTAGFAITGECFSSDGKRQYHALTAVYSQEPVPHTPADYYIGRVPRTPEGIRFLTRQCRRLQDRLTGLSRTGGSAEEIERLQQHLQAIREWLQHADHSANSEFLR